MTYGIDLHKHRAAAMFGVDYTEVTDEQRAVAKAVAVQEKREGRESFAFGLTNPEATQ